MNRKRVNINYKEITVLIVISIVFVYPYLFNNDIYVGHDLTFHLNRLIGIKDALMDGQFLPKLYPLANNGFGYASPLFYCDIFLLPFALLQFIGISPIVAYKIMVLSITVFISFSTYYILKSIFSKKYIPYVITIVYLFNSYILYDLYARSSLGEFIALAIIPWVIYFIYRVLVRNEDCYILLGVSFASLVMCHLISAYVYVIIFAILIIVYVILNKQIKVILPTLIKASVLGFMLASWFILPMFEQMHSQEFYVNYNSKHFIINNTTQNILNILSPITHMDLNGRYIFDIISVGPMMFILPSFYIFIRKNKYINILLICIFISMLMMIGIIPIPNLLSILQFAFRLNIVILPLSAIIMAYVFDNVKEKTFKVLSMCVLVFVFVNFVIFTFEMLNDGKYYLRNNANKNDINNVTSSLYDLDYNHDELGGAEYLPYTLHTDYLNDSLKIQKIDENGKGVDLDINYQRNYSEITFNYDGGTEDVMLPISFYKGYKGYKCINGECVEQPIFNMEVFKKVGLKLDGSGEYIVRYEGTKVQNISLAISSISFLSLMYLKCVRRIK